jgi:hypothetical protein
MRRDGERSAAKAAGLARYTTGRPCKRGHVAERRTRDGRCVECWNQKLIPSQSKHREYSAAWRHRHPERQKEVKIRHLYGIEISEIRPKPGACEICGSEHKKIVLDHCHHSGVFRGWICDPCNIALGNVGDSIETLERMIEYLRASQINNLVSADNGMAKGTERQPKGRPEG